MRSWRVRSCGSRGGSLDLGDSHEWLMHRLADEVASGRLADRMRSEGVASVTWVPDVRPSRREPPSAYRTPMPPEVRKEAGLDGSDRYVRRKPGRPTRRRRHWSQGFQRKFSLWLRGQGHDLAPVLGYTKEEACAHLERQFRPGMSWGNYAGNMPWRTKRRTWCVDHVQPKSRFSEDDVAIAFALTNLRPLWLRENMRKGMQRTHLI